MDTELAISESSAERVPPQSLEAEQAVLGSLLNSADGMSRIVDILEPDYFYRKAHQLIYAAAQDLFDKSEPIDIITMSQFLKDASSLDQVGGRQYITDLALGVATTANLEYYAKVVQEKALLRHLIRAGTEIVASCYEETDAEVAIDKAEAMIFSLAQRRNMNQLVHVKHVVQDAFQKIEERYENRDQLSGVTTGFYDLDALTSGFQPNDLVIVAARPSMGKCLAFDSEIVVQDGSIKTIEEIYKDRTASLLTLNNELKLEWVKPTAFVDDGIKPVFKVTTRLGKQIETTLSHPFLTINGWKKLEEIRVGHKIAVPRRVEAFGQEKMRECEIKLLAYLIGDGCLSNGKVSFTNTNSAIQQDFAEAVSEFGGVSLLTEVGINRAPQFIVRTDSAYLQQSRAQFGENLSRIITERKVVGRRLAHALNVSPSSVTHWTKGQVLPQTETFDQLCQTLEVEASDLLHDCKTALARNAVSTWLSDLGLLGKTSHDKFVPPSIFKLARKQAALFLNRLFSTDGWATVLATGQSQIGYASVSEKLCRQIQHLLLRFGIIAKLRKRTVKYKNSLRTAFQLDVTDKKSIQTFINEIGIFGKELAVQRVLVSVELKRNQTNCDLIPIEVWNDIKIAKGADSWASVARRCNLIDHSNLHVDKRSLSRPRLLSLATGLQNDKLFDLATSDIYWDEIVSIESMGMKQVYDLTIPDTHNFVSNDICVHNTAFVLNVANAAAIGAGVPVALFSLEMSKEQLVQRMLCSEANIDANRLRTGHMHTNDWTSLAMAMGKLGEAPIFIDDSAMVTALDVRAKCRRLKAEQKGLGLVIIDYIQLMSGRKATDNRVQEVSEISRSLKQLAREIACPVIALSQLSRAVEARQNKRPMLSDLRESGCLTGDSLVFLPDQGTYARIDSLVGQKDFNVLAVNPTTWKLESRKVENAFCTGNKPVFEMTTKTNRKIKATANHKFLTASGWKRLDELLIGEDICAPKQLPSSIIANNSNKDAEPKQVSSAIVEPAQTTRGTSAATMIAPTKTATVAQNNIVWDEITAIEPAGTADVYDLTVEGLHNFVVNNLIAHNSIEQDADIVMFIYRDEYYNPESDRRGEAEIIIAKQRSGPVGTVELLYQASITKFLNKVHNQYTTAGPE